MDTTRFGLSELVGNVAGWALAPVTGTVSAIRRARMFHPEGTVYAARVEPVAETPWPEVAATLSGPAFVRLSSAWWRGGLELPDALGVAIRFRETTTASPEPGPGDQDLLLATIRHPWTTPFAPLTTHVHDFLDNDYYGVSPFAIGGAGVGYLRAVASRARVGGDDRGRRLAHAVAAGDAWLRLEACIHGPSGGRSARDWHPIALIRLTAPQPLDDTALHFSPFRSGRGLVPRGFIHALRRAAYLTSQRARDLTAPAPRVSLSHPLASIGEFSRAALRVIRPAHEGIHSAGAAGGNGELRDDGRR